ncbi:MAG: FMN-binding protein [Ruminococcaceae bacterium]|nr:FMN-binding protein [Oscillospiraceae bacterium]
MKNYIKTIVSLTVICAVISALLALGNSITAPIIEKNQASAANESLKVVMPDGEEFQEVDITKYKLPESVSSVFSEKNGGYVFTVEVTGYSSGLIIMCGVDKNGTVTGTLPIASAETLGYENTYGEKLSGATLETIDAVDTISGATKTTAAYKTAVKDSLNAFVIMGGGSVDLRSEEEILNDELSKALPSADGKFTEVFLTENVTHIKALFKADNETGYVAYTLSLDGNNYIATDKDGNVPENSDATVVEISNEIKMLISSKLTEIDITAYQNMPAQIQKAYKTNNGNFVFELRAAGYGINGGNQWHPASGEYIYIKASASADGKIIAVKTLSQKESEGIGDACADKKFYSQFDGKTEENYGEIDAISGATITTNGYKTAISKIFEAIKILKGEV